MFHDADGRTDMTKLIVAFRNFANAPKKKGIPTVKWTENVELDLRNMGVNRWRKRDLDRTDWASVVREAEAKFKGLWCLTRRRGGRRRRR